MQREPAYDHVECPIFKRKVLRIGGAERNIGNAALFRALFPDRQHGIRQVDADDFSRGARKRFRDVSRPRRDIQHALIACEARRGHQPPNALFVSDPRIRRKGLSLRRKRFSNDVVVLRHSKILAHGSQRIPCPSAKSSTDNARQGFNPHNSPQ